MTSYPRDSWVVVEIRQNRFEDIYVNFAMDYREEFLDWMEANIGLGEPNPMYGMSSFRHGIRVADPLWDAVYRRALDPNIDGGESSYASERTFFRFKNLNDALRFKLGWI